MSSTAESPGEGEEARAKLGWPIWAALLVGLLTSGWVLMQATSRPDVTGMQNYARGSLARLQMSVERPAAPANTFMGPDGRPVRIADLPGRVKVVNLWATNCAPCIIEMPTLAALARSYPAGQVSVTPISLDPVGLTDKAKTFLAKNQPLPFHQDPSFQIAFAMKAGALPTTVIYDAQGRERARLTGAAEWDGPEARALFDRLLAE